MTAYYVYWIVSDTHRSYIGATIDPRRRLRQHNSELVGGARRTRGGLWHFQCIVSGFRTWKEALQAEWAFKYHSRHCRGIPSRQSAIERVLAMPRWTSNSPPASEVPLVVEYEPTNYGHPPETLPSATSAKPVVHKAPRVGGKPKFKKNLHGVNY